MKEFIGKLVLSTLAVLITSEILPGITIDDPLNALLVAIILALLNATLKPILIIFTIPFTIMTLGIFLLFINGFIILLAHKLIDGFYVNGFLWAIIFSIVLSLIESVLEHLISNKSRKNY